MNDILTDEKLAQINESSHQGSTFEFEASYDQTKLETNRANIIFISPDLKPKDITNYAKEPFKAELGKTTSGKFCYELDEKTASEYCIVGINEELKESISSIEQQITSNRKGIANSVLILELTLQNDVFGEKYAELKFGVQLKSRAKVSSSNLYTDKEKTTLTIDPVLIISRPIPPN
ncbi:hypothetical protein [Pseudoalteromonas sp. Of7M-16]|uniref:hypothetical protein n=1 Tax=Pseudoalteromonas sp. Of7M-16 TaxID=2917756 RepID=UPI001EF6A194|nr:hypothetical protein [Pseudoalteromonas sp. Of7M-16]MCG7546948.1 hypothetical protein [Pseudoalteromonas sp. Of7M-16]